MPWPGLHWCVCCRQGFNLLGREHAEKEEEESFELRNKDEVKSNGRVSTKTILNTNQLSLSFFPCLSR